MKHRRLSAQTKQVMRIASQLAKNFGHERVSSGHLLLALFSCPETLRLLCRSGLSEARASAAFLSENPGKPSCKVRGLSPSATALLTAAGKEVGQKTEPVHLLLAILRQPDAVCLPILQTAAVCPEVIFSDAVQSIRPQFSQTEDPSMQSTRLLEQFGINMVEQADRYAPVIGREQEISSLICVLCRKTKNNPALIGSPGVGKTAIVEGLAKRMADGQVPPPLIGKRLILLSMASLIAGTKYRGEFEERVRDILFEIQRNQNVILFVDEMHTLCGAGAAEGAIDASNLLKPALGRGELQLIGATTYREYHKYIEKDAALERRFCKIQVDEPTPLQTEQILFGLRPGLEQHHGMPISDSAIHAAVELSCRFIPNRFLPDKALDLLDESAAHKRLSAPKASKPHRLLSEQIHTAVQAGNYERAALLQNKLEQAQQKEHTEELSREDLLYGLSLSSGIPLQTLSESECERLNRLETLLRKRIIGQEDAVQAVCNAIRLGRSGLCDRHRPIASVLLVGPTGVGKTALCKALTEAVFGSEEAMIRLDMSEYMEKISATRLIGSPPGYVGCEDGGELTEKVRRKPYSVVLFDEIEKAHRDVTHLLLQVMEDGMLTDSGGQRVNFCNTILIMTSNLGAQHGSTIGFESSSRSDALRAVRAHFSPEFLGRLDAVICMLPLRQADLISIASLQLEALAARAKACGVSLTFSPALPELLAGRCSCASGGARQIRHLLRDEIESPLARLLLTGATAVCAEAEENKIVLHPGVKVT
ncbi:MAG: ATP-dependent Clp protease ATP-binding subunit [Clostridia bacterium]|nr:ATP-dependent Clp protease ATP-binding subunit [Clostridia bacterium]